MKVSAIVLAKNESMRIGKCLDSVSWTDERIVLDNGSTDDTPALAKKHGARVIKTNSKSFADIRNLGKEVAKGDWIFYVDADEIVPQELTQEVQSVITDPKSMVAFSVRRKNFYLGRPWPYEEKILRLFQKSHLLDWYGDLHESPRIEGKTGELSAPLLHDTHRTLGEMVTKTNEWSEIEAHLRLESRHPPITWWRFLRVMITGFSDSFFRQGGWRAGTVGWIESLYQAFSIFITYAKLWEKQREDMK